MAPKNPKTSKGPLTASFITGAIALIFLILGYQSALFIHRASVMRLVANRDHPDTVYIVEPAPQPAGKTAAKVVRKSAPHSTAAVQVREQSARRPVENFRFDPNTVSLEDLQRLGFSEKQAQAIDSYRQKGGRFRRPADFARSYVVADSVYERLAPYIDIPRVDINQADSAALLALPGIGPYFAGKVVQYRAQLGGYSRPEQLMDIYHFDAEKYAGLSDLISCSEPAPFPLWTLPEADLARHPYLSRDEAHAIVLFRQHHAPDACTVEALHAAGILSEDHYSRLSLCCIAPAQTLE